MSGEILSSVVQDFSLTKQIKIHDHPQMREQPIVLADAQPSANSFNQMMQDQSPPKQVVDPLKARLPSPMQEAARQGGTLRVAEAKQISAVLDRFQRSQQSQWTEMKSRLDNNSSVNLSPATALQLQMKMSSINNQFNRLNQNMGVASANSSSTTSPADTSNSATNPSFQDSLKLTTSQLSKPLETFFNFIARGERQLYGVQNDIDAIFAKGETLVNPAVMLKLQLKMTHISQQLELFTSMLNKGLESSKTVFNTQI